MKDFVFLNQAEQQFLSFSFLAYGMVGDGKSISSRLYWFMTLKCMKELKNSIVAKQFLKNIKWK